MAQLKRQLHSTTLELQWAHLKIQVLEARLRLQRIQKYGPASEKLNDAQLELLELEPGVSGAEVQAESEREPPRHRRAAGSAARIRDGRHCRRICPA
jgi:hypothetical protein